MRRSYLILILVGAVFLIVFNLPSRFSQPVRSLAREGTAAHQGALTRFAQNVQLFFGNLGRGARLRRERDAFDDQARMLQAELRKRDVVLRENEQLRALLELPRRLGYSQRACQVIAREDASGWWQTVCLNRGTLDGLTTNLLVVTPAGVVGRTLNVTARTADVLLMTDRNFLLSVQFPESGAYGILRGGGVSGGEEPRLDVLCAAQPAEVEFIRKDASVRSGDMVVTSGLGGRYPPGVLLGYVDRVVTNRTGLYLEASVVPSADLGRLRFVSVLVPAGP